MVLVTKTLILIAVTEVKFDKQEYTSDKN